MNPVTIPHCILISTDPPDWCVTQAFEVDSVPTWNKVRRKVVVSGFGPTRQDAWDDFRKELDSWKK